MAKEEVSITFYSIGKCGYYKPNESSPEFGNDVGKILKQLDTWASSQHSLRNTATYEETEHYKRTFCYSMHEHNNRYLLVTWNEASHMEGSVAAVKGSDPVGTPTIKEHSFQDDEIPGFAAYYYIIPDRNEFANIVFPGQLNGHQNMVRYIKHFLKHCSPHAVSTTKHGAKKYLGYKDILEIGDNSFNPIDNHLTADFDTHLIRNPGKIDEIRQNVSKIRKLVTRTNVKRYSKGDGISDKLDKLIEMLLAIPGLSDPKEDRFQYVKLAYEMTFSPNEDELNTIISSWNDKVKIEGENVGFKMEGDSTVHWLGESLAKTKYELDITRVSEHMVNAEALLHEIYKSESHIRTKVTP